MGQIKDIKDFVESVALDVDGIETFAFDVLSSVNTNRDKTYPLFLLKCPQTAKKERPTIDWKGYEISCYAFDTHFQTDTRELAEVWDELEGYCELVINGLRTLPNLYRVNREASITWQYGQYEHNDQLVVVGFTLTLDTFHCFEAPVVADNFYLLIDSLNYLLIDDSSHKLIIQ